MILGSTGCNALRVTPCVSDWVCAIASGTVTLITVLLAASVAVTAATSIVAARAA